MTQVDKQLEQLQTAGVASLRTRLNQLFNALGLKVSTGSAQLLSLGVIALILVQIFFVVNLGVGMLLGELFDSYGLGFLALGASYLLLLAAYLGLRPRLERRWQARMARQVHRLSDNINQELNSVESLRVSPEYQEAYISSEPNPYQSLRLRRDEARRQAQRAERDLRQGVQYIRANYISIFGSMASQTIPAYRYLAPVAALLDKERQRRAERGSQAEDSAVAPPWVRYVERHAKSLLPLLPYLSVAYKVLRPVVSAFVVTRTQNWLLGRLLSFGRKKRR